MSDHYDGYYSRMRAKALLSFSQSAEGRQEPLPLSARTPDEHFFMRRHNPNYHSTTSAPYGLEIYPYLSSSRHSKIDVKLENQDQWNGFNQIGAELLITRLGSRMFPRLNFHFTNMDLVKMYHVSVKFCPADGYRYDYINSRWKAVDKIKPFPKGESEFYFHPDSPKQGHEWMANTHSFSELRLTCYYDYRANYIFLSPMHKYVPVVSVIPASATGIGLDWHLIRSFQFPRTCFMAVNKYSSNIFEKLLLEMMNEERQVKTELPCLSKTDNAKTNSSISEIGKSEKLSISCSESPPENPYKKTKSVQTARSYSSFCPPNVEGSYLRSYLTSPPSTPLHSTLRSLSEDKYKITKENIHTTRKSTTPYDTTHNAKVLKSPVPQSVLGSLAFPPTEYYRGYLGMPHGTQLYHPAR